MSDELVKELRHCVYGDCADCNYYDNLNCADLAIKAADAIEELMRRCEQFQYMPPPAWIPVTERLPEDGVAVNITWVNHSPSIYYQHLKDKPQTATGVYYRRKWYWWSNVVQDYLAEYGEWGFDEMDDAIEVTHWMPIPEPPKEET